MGTEAEQLIIKVSWIHQFREPKKIHISEPFYLCSSNTYMWTSISQNNFIILHLDMPFGNC